MLINKDTLDALRTQFSLIFTEAYSGTKPWYTEIATDLPSSSKSNTYGWVARSVKLREWVGPRMAANLAEHAYTITNKRYEGTIEVDRDDLEDDNLGVYTAMLIPQLGEATAKHPDQLIVEMLLSNSGAGPIAFDGKNLFADDHPKYDEAGNTYDNKFGLALTADNFNTVWAEMVSYTGEDGKPLGVMPNKLFVPPQLKKAALSIMQSTTAAQPVRNVAGSEVVGAATIDNVLKGWAEVVVLEELAVDPTRWYVADTRRAIKPIIYQKRRAPQFISRVNPEDPKVFDLAKFTYGVDYRGNVGVSLPFLIATSKP